MYELFVALKYLIPKKRAISTSVISLISFLVISLVVWLILVFLSVTSGLEQNWLKKLTSVNAPIRITPTNDYYKSYYYLIDNLSSDSFYETKTIGEKKASKSIDPYSHDFDMEIPFHWNNPDLDSNGKLIDPVRIAFQKLDDLKDEYPLLNFQDYEASAAFMRLTVNHDLLKTSFISQMTYILSLSEANPNISELIIKPTEDDISNILIKKHNTLKDRETYASTDVNYNEAVLDNIKIKKVKIQNSIPYYFFPDNISFYVKEQMEETPALQFFLSPEKSSAKLIKKKDKFYYLVENTTVKSFNAENILIYTEQPTIFDVYLTENHNKTLFIKSKLQKKEIKGKISLNECQLHQVNAITDFEEEPKLPPPWIYSVRNKGYRLPNINQHFGVLFPKCFKKNQVLIGDNGYFGYSSASSTASKEMRMPFYVAGFYDPGVFPLGSRFIIAPIDLIRIINSSSFISTSEISNNGIFVWNTPLKETKAIKAKLKDKFVEKKIDKYWKIETYEDFDFSKDLLLQFQSDKLLFSLIAIIILMVACSNIISMLILLVNDKKKEIAILMSLGSTKKSIALIFGVCGFITGFLSSAIGTLLAIFTLKHIDKIASLLSTIQGHQAFNVAFFGSSLPNNLSISALLFVLIATPIISILAGIIPAFKASRINPSRTLRM